MADTPIFIGGLMKSGTSLLRKLVSRHPNIFGGLETFWFSEEFTQHWKDSESKRQKWLREFYEVSYEDYQTIKETSNSPTQFLEQFLQFCTHRAGKKRWVEKTPDNILHMDKIWTFWPEAKVIHVLRDPLDVYASWKKNEKRDLNFFLGQLHQIQDTIPVFKASKPDKYMEINYSDLVSKPQNTIHCLKEVCSFLGEAYEPIMANYKGDNNQDFDKLLEVTGKSSATAESLGKPIFNSSINQWKSILTQEEVNSILVEGENYFKTFGLPLNVL